MKSFRWMFLDLEKAAKAYNFFNTKTRFNVIQGTLEIEVDRPGESAILVLKYDDVHDSLEARLFEIISESLI